MPQKRSEAEETESTIIGSEAAGTDSLVTDEFTHYS
jgi:hypothetical protein